MGQKRYEPQNGMFSKETFISPLHKPMCEYAKNVVLTHTAAIILQILLQKKILKNMYTKIFNMPGKMRVTHVKTSMY